MFSQKELELTEKDKTALQGYIQVSWILSPILTVAAILAIGVLLAVVFGLITIFTGEQPVISEPGTKSLVLIGFCSIILMIGIYQNILTRMDIRYGRKVQYKTNDYKLQEKGNNLYLIINSPKKKKIELLEDALKDMIQVDQPLTIELTRYNKSVLFISNNSDNLLDKIEEVVYQNGSLADEKK